VEVLKESVAIMKVCVTAVEYAVMLMAERTCVPSEMTVDGQVSIMLTVKLMECPATPG